MSIVYTYKVNGARVVTENGLTDVVKEMDITVTGMEGSTGFSLPTTVKLSAPEAETFVAFSSLTEDDMIAWVSSMESLDATKAHIALVVAKEMEKAALTSKSLPWVPVPVTPETTPAAE